MVSGRYDLITLVDAPDDVSIAKRAAGIVSVFAKPAIPGKVKTRLAQSISAESAADLATAMLRDVWSAATFHPWVRAVLATTEFAQFPVDVRASDVWLQGEGTLGDKLQRIFERALHIAPLALAIGADTPTLSTAHIDSAISVLNSAHAVIGPASDGGFYLLGLRSCPPGLFNRMEWSCATTAEQMCKRMIERGMSVAQIEILRDVDVAEDLVEIASDPRCGPHTRAWLNAR